MIYTGGRDDILGGRLLALLLLPCRSSSFPRPGLSDAGATAAFNDGSQNHGNQNAGNQNAGNQNKSKNATTRIT